MEEYASPHFSAWARQVCVERSIIPEGELLAFSDDASFRRYYRFVPSSTGLVFVNSPPDKEDNESFIKISKVFQEAGLLIPIVEAFDLDMGYLAVTDLGDRIFLDELRNDPSKVKHLIRLAVNEIFRIQEVSCELPSYSQKKIMEEMRLFDKWFLKQLLGIEVTRKLDNLLSGMYRFLARRAVDQPQVFVHRDYHSRNLMLNEDFSLAMIDFQDAVLGPVTYDLVSLLRDCYFEFDSAHIYEEVEFFRKALLEREIIGEDVPFSEWFDLMGVQRHLKCAGIFSRLNLRDNKPKYLRNIPDVIRYLQEISFKYPELNSFHDFLSSEVIPQTEKFMLDRASRK